MSVVTVSRKASVDEVAAEMDRRGRAIEKLEAQRDALLDALRDIDAVAVDYGHYESAARTMKEIAGKAVQIAPGCPGFEVEPGVFSGCNQSAGDCPVCGK